MKSSVQGAMPTLRGHVLQTSRSMPTAAVGMAAWLEYGLPDSSFIILHSSFLPEHAMNSHPFADITARDIMHADPIVVGPDQSLADLRHLLIKSQISGVPVVSSGKLVGIISRSD